VPTVVVVDAEKLPSAPAGLQKYVEKFFRERDVLGKRCFVAYQKLFFNHTDWEHYRMNPEGCKGKAPGHSVDMHGYDEGTDGKGLSSWMHDNNGKGIVWMFHAPEDHDGCGGFDDD
jgi:hypothetical protein